MTHPLDRLRKQMGRDQQIVICYKAGHTVIEIGHAFGISKQRVGQILQAAGCTRDDNPKTRNRKLYAFIGANLTPALKAAVVKETKRRGISISQYLLWLIKKDLSLDLGEGHEPAAKTQ